MKGKGVREDGEKVGDAWTTGEGRERQTEREMSLTGMLRRREA